MVYERVPYDHWRIQSPFEEMKSAGLARNRPGWPAAGRGDSRHCPVPDLHETAIENGMKVIPAQQAFSQLSLFFGGMYLMPGGPDFDPTTPWADQRVRQAMNKAINRDELNEFIFKGRGSGCTLPPAATRFWTATSTTRSGIPAGMPSTLRPEEAKRLLAEAGYGPDNPVKVEIINYRTSGSLSPPIAVEAMPQYWGPVGIEADHYRHGFRAYSKKRREKQMQHQIYANVFSFRKIHDRIRTEALPTPAFPLCPPLH